MTEDLKAGRELDALVAEKVMGVSREMWPSICRVDGHSTDDDGISEWCYDCNDLTSNSERVPPPYSTRMAAAWKVVEKVGGWFHLVNFPSLSTWRASFHYDAVEEYREADTAPLAICRAALKAGEAA